MSFDFGSANEDQRKAITTTDGPLLVIAGPGSGKTFTLIHRALYLIQEKGVDPKQIFLTTFTEKGAGELKGRLATLCDERGLKVNVEQMFIGTMHSLFFRIIRDFGGGLFNKNLRMIDDFEQKYIVRRNLKVFDDLIEKSGLDFAQKVFDKAKNVCEVFNCLKDELVLSEELKDSGNENLKIIGEALDKYDEILEERGILDFASCQEKAFRMLNERPEILEEVREKFQYFMIDEYQDTNYVQERLIELLVGEKDGAQNICVVGDDDQALYRFRGATVQNILQFPDKYKKYKKVELEINYRSNKSIIDFYNEWMKMPNGFKWEDKNRKYRYDKQIVPAKSNPKTKSPAVAKWWCKNPEPHGKLWGRDIAKFIKDLKKTGKITDFNQVVILASSVRSNVVRDGLIECFKEEGLPVYAPRADYFFKNDLIKIAIGAIISVFDFYVQKIKSDDAKYLSIDALKYYNTCLTNFEMRADDDFKKRIKKFKDEINLSIETGNDTNSNFTSILTNGVFGSREFKKVLNSKESDCIYDIRALAQFSSIVKEFDRLQQIFVLNGKWVERNAGQFFNEYLRFLNEGGIDEYEDDLTPCPSGYVSFMTIHQSKGLEFPIVMLPSLYDKISRNNFNINITEKTLELIKMHKLLHREIIEPEKWIKHFDFWRKYYVAFSRAQNLLLMPYFVRGGAWPIPGEAFKPMFERVPDFKMVKTSEHDFKENTQGSLKPSLSLSADFDIYEHCPTQYKFEKIYEIKRESVGAATFGSLVHQTIEDVHNLILKGDKGAFDVKTINTIFEENYKNSLKSALGPLRKAQKELALKQVVKYVGELKERGDKILDCEMPVSQVGEHSILTGVIDLVKQDKKTGDVSIVDFKTWKKDDLLKYDKMLNHYKRQLMLYAHLYHEETGVKPKKLVIQCTDEKRGGEIPFDFNEKEVKGTIKKLKSTAKEIVDEKFEPVGADAQRCKGCGCKSYCKDSKSSK